MRAIAFCLLVNAVLFCACQRDKSTTKEHMTVAASPVQTMDKKTGQDIVNTVQKLTTEPAQGLSAEDKAAAKDPGKLLGRWAIKHTIYKTNGKASEPSPPLVPASWNFGKDGRLEIIGGMNLDARYVYTGDQLIISAIGPTQTYEVQKLAEQELVVVAKISAGSVQIENTTVLSREKNQR